MSRAKAVLKVAAERFNLQTLNTKENLKRVGILSDKVGSICKFKRFKNGIPVLTSSSSSENDGSESEQDEGISSMIRARLELLDHKSFLYVSRIYIVSFLTLFYIYMKAWPNIFTCFMQIWPLKFPVVLESQKRMIRLIPLWTGRALRKKTQIKELQIPLLRL